MHILALHEPREEAADVGVAGTVGIHDLFGGKLNHRVSRELSLRYHDRRIATLGDHYSTGPAALLGKSCHLLRNRRDIRLGPTPCFGEYPCFGLIPEKVVDERQG